MAALTKSMVTTNHEEIRRWAAARNGTPAAIIRPESADERASRICIDFPENHNNGSRKEISWRDWFKKFDAAGLALLYQEHTANGERSNFHKVVTRETVDEVEAAVGGKGRSASHRSRRDREVGVVAAPRDGGARRDSGRSAGLGKVAKKSSAVARIVTTARKLKHRKSQATPSRSAAKSTTGRAHTQGDD